MTENEIIREIKNISNNEDNRFSFIAKYIIQNLNVVQHITIKEMAEYAYTSVATIHRFTKSLNLDGYKELIHIIKYFNHNIVGDGEDTLGNTNNSLIINAYHNVIHSLHDTFRLSLLQKQKILNIIDIIKNAQKITIYAVGGTFNVAKDFYEKLLRLGFNVVPVNDFHNGYFLSRQSSVNDCCIFISYSGETTDLIKLAKIVKENKTPIIVVCKQADNTLAKISDFDITISSNESIERLYSTTSRFALLFILDMIYFTIISSEPDKYRGILENTIITKF